MANDTDTTAMTDDKALSANPMINGATVISVGLVVWALFVVLHELIGHAGIAAIQGEDVRGVATTTAHIHDFYEPSHVSSRIGYWGFRSVCAGGALMNYVTAGVALLLLASTKVRRPSMRYFLWLFASISIVQQSFWLAVQPFLGLGGDWIAFLNGLHSPLLWKTLLTATGIALFFLGIMLPLRLWRPALPSDRRKWAVWKLAGLPLAAAFVMQLASVFWAPLSWSRYGVIVTVLTFVPLGIWLVIIRRSTRWSEGADRDTRFTIPFHAGWVAAAFVMAVLFVALLGPGIGSFEGHPQFEG